MGETLLIPAGISLGAEKDGALVVVHAVDLTPVLGEEEAYFGADEAGGTGDEGFHGNLNAMPHAKVAKDAKEERG